MLTQRPNTNALTPLRLVLAFLCIALVVFCGTVQVVHAHPLGDASDIGCSLCATAHVAVQVSDPSPVILHVAPVLSYIEEALPTSRSNALSTFALFTRPPPADAAIS